MRDFLLKLYRQGEVLQGEAAEEARHRTEPFLARRKWKTSAGETTRATRTGQKYGRPQPDVEPSETRRGDIGFCVGAGGPFTNNQAERDLWPVKVKQKVSGSFRTGHGAARYARLQGIILTCRKQGRPVFQTLRTLFAHQPLHLVAAEG